MSPRFLFLFPLFGLAGCSVQTNTSETATSTAVPLASLPRQRKKAEAHAAFQAELLRPAPRLSELSSAGTPRFPGPPPGSPAANYLASFNDPRPKRGLIICEPQGAKARSFGAGCARWMKAMGAGSTAFEVVPTWSMGYGFIRSKGWSDLALGRGRAVELARGMDASHVAIGSFDGQKLQYQLLDVRKVPSKIVGSFEVKGTSTQLVAQLPGLTRKLVNATGVKGAQVPARVGLGTEDLAFLGSISYDTVQLQKLKPAQLSRLSRLAGHPVGALFIGRTPIVPKPAHLQAARTLLAAAPTNALLAGEVARFFLDVEKERRTQVLRLLDRKFPRNESIALGNAMLRGGEGDYFATIHYAEMAVRVAPHSPIAWYMLAEALSSQAGEKRRGAGWEQMTAGQRMFVQRVYPQAQAAAWKAVNLDPKDPQLWITLSSTSTMNSNAQWARDALAQALKIDPHNEEALNWGIEIFQPKWFGDAATVATMGRLAVANAGRGELDADALCLALRHTDQDALIRPLLQKLVAKEPQNVPALRQYSYVVRMDLGDFKAALPYARRAVRLAPNDTQSLSELADIQQHDLGQYEESIKLFRRAIQLEPQNPLHWVNMALSYAKWGKKSEARTYAVKGHALGYNGPHPVWNMVGLGPDGSEPAPTTPPSPPLVAH